MKMNFVALFWLQASGQHKEEGGGMLLGSV